MTDSTQSVDIAVNNMLTMLQEQIMNIQSLTDNHVTLLDDALNDEAKQYNSLIDTVEKIERENKTLELKVIELTTQLDQKEHESNELITSIRNECNNLKIKASALPEIKSELKRQKLLKDDCIQ